MQSRYYILLLLILIAYLPLAQNCTGTDATGLAPGIYKEGTDGKLHAITNVDITSLWKGAWKDDTNGLRTELQLENDGAQVVLRIGVGSAVFNSLGGYVGSPKGTFTKFELRDSNCVIVPFSQGINLESKPPFKLNLGDLPRWPNGGLKSHIGFFTNGGPWFLDDVNLNEVYKIEHEGDYALTVCPVIYKFGTNAQYLDRVNMPCIATKIHLKPLPAQ